MMRLSTRAKEAIKTALAITIAYAIALSMDWQKPIWGGLTVAVISLPTIGQSMRMGILRILGTLIAGVAAVLVISAFAQDRWWFLITLSAYLGFCTYRMLDSKHGPGYMVAGAVAAIICFGSGLESLPVFNTIVERVLETGTGILVYTLVSVLLWPQSSKSELYDVSHKIGVIQRQLFRAYQESFAGRGEGEGTERLRMQQGQLLAQLGKVRAGSEADSYEVWENRHQWQRFQQLSASVADALERWRTTFPEARAFELSKLLPTYDIVCAELDARLADIERMLGGQSSRHDPCPLDLATSEAHVDRLDHFQKAALETIRSELHRLDTLSRALFECIASLKGHRREPATPRSTETFAPDRPVIDLDRLGAVTRVLAGLWIAYLIWVFIEPPQAQFFVILTAVFGIVLVQVPWLPVAKLFVPFTVAVVLAGLIYVFVMPQLTGFAQLGALIFTVMFATSYLLADPKLAGLKIIGLVVFLLLISVQNEQTYSFATYANLVVAMACSLFVLIAAAHIPTSPRPEKAFIRLLKRFFRHAEVLISRLSLDRSGERNRVRRYWEMALYANDFSGLPQRIGVWSTQIDHRTFPENSPEQVQALVGNVEILARRIGMLTEARRQPQAQVLVQNLLADVRAWRLALQKTLRTWSMDPDGDPGGDRQVHLAAKLADMENRISEVLSGCDEHTLTDHDYENFYRLLGAARSLTEVVMEYDQLAGGVTWAHWKETRL